MTYTGFMKVDLSYVTDPNWWGREKTTPEPYTFKEVGSQIDRHYETASRLIELAAWNMREAERLAKTEDLRHYRAPQLPGLASAMPHQSAGPTQEPRA